MHQQLAAAARTDAKTGLLNATAWQRKADAEVIRALRAGTPLSLLLLDVDHFKQVNDSHGHLIGDDVLRALATELRQQVRESDVVGRFGGEEFTILLPRTDGNGACRIAERLRKSAGLLSVAADPKTDARIRVTVSIGRRSIVVAGASHWETSPISSSEWVPSWLLTLSSAVPSWSDSPNGNIAMRSPKAANRVLLASKFAASGSKPRTRQAGNDRAYFSADWPWCMPPSKMMSGASIASKAACAPYTSPWR